MWDALLLRELWDAVGRDLVLLNCIADCIKPSMCLKRRNKRLLTLWQRWIVLSSLPNDHELYLISTAEKTI